MKIYVASSWRCPHQQTVVESLRRRGHDVYDFENADTAFCWEDIDPEWRSWTPEQFDAALQHPLAVIGHQTDVTALLECDACVLVQSCGASAHLELGWAIGAGKITVVLLDGASAPELMYRSTDKVSASLDDVADYLAVRDYLQQPRLTHVHSAVMCNGHSMPEGAFEAQRSHPYRCGHCGGHVAEHLRKDEDMLCPSAKESING